MTFEALGLSPPFSASHDAPTAVQTAAIPPILAGRDVRASAQTGSGKTAAFLLPLLQAKRRTLVLVPTRELAQQIGDAVGRYGQAKCVVAVGGISINPQMMALRGGTDFLIATPGRLLDLVEQNAVRLARFETLVLDEADRMLSLGFSAELDAVLAQLPARRQTLLFSATLPAKVLALADAILRDPVCINIDSGATASLLQQRAIEVDENMRAKLLQHLLAHEPWSRVLVFVASKEGANALVAKLRNAAALHGDLSQTARSAALADFKASRLRVLVATDVAARGLDVVDLAAVVNFDLPRSPADYVHRVGRTSRAGATGIAVSFISAATAAHFRLIEKRNRLEVPREQVAGFAPKDMTPPKGDPHGGKKGKRPNKKDKLRAKIASAAARSDRQT